MKHLIRLSILFFLLFIHVTCEKDEPEPEPSQGSLTDTRGDISKTYKTVKIGNQWWMAENLAYNVGDGCWAYDNDETNVATYGRLYNVEAAEKACPSGWHLPTDTEWMQLEMVIGMSESEAGDIDDRGTNEGTKLKATSGWNNTGNGTDDYGFSALPGGARYTTGDFHSIGDLGTWWSANETSNSGAWSRTLYSIDTKVYRNFYYVNLGFSVRCVRD
jgi:uncharacterized protein (TIGR02145 family)